MIHRKPYQAASINTFRRWIKATFAETNLIESFTTHSCQPASATKAFDMNPDI